MAKSTVLVVDDESSLRETIAYALRREGFVVETAAEGTRALAIARERKPDLIVLDIMLPGLDGLQICRALRRESSVPILMLSAKGEELDRVLGLEIGADDYLTKPFAMRELVARIKANLRRVQLEAARAVEPSATINAISLGELSMDPASRRAAVGNRLLALKPKEFDLLLHLANRPDHVFTRAQLLRDVWGYEYQINTRTVDVHVRWLRQKLNDSGGNVPRIETSRRVGYQLTMSLRPAGDTPD